MTINDKSNRPHDARTPVTAQVIGIAELEPGALALIQAQGRAVTAPKAATIFAPGDACQSLVLLTKGAIQVGITSESGRELMLYRVRPGETCVMSVACLMGANQYQAEAVTETDIEGVAITRSVFDTLIATSPAFRAHILAIQTRRIFGLVELIDEVAFQGTEARLATRLLALSAGGRAVEETHQQLADDIGTAREVVSRRLKRLEARGLIKVDRRHIEVRDRDALARLSH